MPRPRQQPARAPRIRSTTRAPEARPAVAETPAVGEAALLAALPKALGAIAPVTALSALLYYLGYVRESTFFAYFGIDLGTVGFDGTDYILRSIASVLEPLGLLLAESLVVWVGHVYLNKWLVTAGRRVSLAILGAACFLATVLLIIGLVGLSGRFAATSTLADPAALGLGALLVEYAVTTAGSLGFRQVQLQGALEATKWARRTLLAGLILIALFWATADIAEDRGQTQAIDVEHTLALQSAAVIYSQHPLELTGSGVTVVKLPGQNLFYTYRYSGLRLLLHHNGRWFLLPAGWTRASGAEVFILPDDSPGYRVDLAP